MTDSYLDSAVETNKMEWRKSHFRDLGRVTYQRVAACDHVEVVQSAGVISGARLEATFRTHVSRIAVRTSFDRELGLTRHADGRWVTIPKVDEVLAVVPSLDDRTSVEVLCFTRETFVSAFDQALAAQQEKRAALLSPKAPIFVSLDSPRGAHPHRAKVLSSGLGPKAEWRRVVPIASIPVAGKSQPAESAVEFVERVKAEFARLQGSDVDDVSVEFRIERQGHVTVVASSRKSG